MTTKVNNYVDIGEFLTGNIDFFTITTLVPCDNTLVSKPLNELKKDLGLLNNEDISTKNGITIYDIFYQNDNEYTDAFNKQENLNNLIKLIETRAQPIMLNIVEENVLNVDTKIPADSTRNSFGSNYSGSSGTVYMVKFATEHEDAWPTQEVIAEELNNRTILDINANVIVNDRFNTNSDTLANTTILKKQFI